MTRIGHSTKSPASSRQPASQRLNTHTTKSNAAQKRRRWEPFALGVALVIATFTAHFPATQAGYIWDDNISLYENLLVRAPNGLYKFWFTTQTPDYWPLSSTIFWLEWQIWGNNPKPYHVTNIALHALSAVVLWRVLIRLGLSGLGGFLGGLLFAIHPVTVESVAWISERKNVLSMTLYLLSILTYLRFTDQGRRTWYILALLAATAALLAKTSVVALPAVLLLLVWWRQNRITRRDIVRTTPFFMISLAFGLTTVWFQSHNAISSDVVRPEGLCSRIATVGWTAWFYLYKTAAPINLTMVYPRWNIDGRNVLSFVPLILLVACFLVLWYGRKSWGRAPLAALASFVIVLAPVLGLLEMSYCRYSLAADHLQYPGMPGPMALAGSTMATAWSWTRRKNIRGLAGGIAALCGIMVLTLAVFTWRQAAVYSDTETLWRDTLRKNPSAWPAYNDLGLALLNRGRADEAIKYFNQALRLKPDYVAALYNRGNAYDDLNDSARAIPDYTRVIELQPKYSMAYNNRGIAYGVMGDRTREIQDYTQAIELKTDNAMAYYNRGYAYENLGDHKRAIQDYTQAIEHRPDLAEAYNSRGGTYQRMGDAARAIEDCTRAIELKPSLADAYCNRAAAYCSLRKYDRAWADVNKSRQLGGKINPVFLDYLVKVSGKAE